MLYDHSILPEILKVDYVALKKYQWDNFVCVTGNEGVGKTHLSLWLIHLWIQIHHKQKPVADDIYKYMGVTLKEYAKVLNAVKKYDINVCDEAGDIFTGKNASSKIVKEMEQTYSVVRSENLFTIWNVPTFFILTPYFRNWRVKSLFYVEKRGLAHFYHKPKRLKLSELNENNSIKDYFAEKPLFSFIFPEYKGVMLENYLKMKNKKTQNVRKKFLDIAMAYDE